MNIVNSGARFQIFGDDVKTYKELPVGSYEVHFSQFEGFFLVSRPDLLVNEEKVYGSHQKRVDKIMRSFDLSARNFGIILSGQKGIGKSLFARLLAQSAISKNMPVITVGINAPGISGFLGSIEQECLIIFDEFEKVFGRESQDEDEMGHSSQEGLLSLFDGLDNGKKLFCITCNNPNDLSNFFLNRPGRFHYHFCLSAPTDEEVREYMTDKVRPEYADQIEMVVRFAQSADITYDYLRAIAFELNQGYSFQEALNDLNICNSDSPSFEAIVTFASGEVFKSYSKTIDFFSSIKSTEWLTLHDSEYNSDRNLDIGFCVQDIVARNGVLSIDPAKVKLQWGRHAVYATFGENCSYHKEKDKMPPVPEIREVVFKKQDYSYVSKYELAY